MKLNLDTLRQEIQDYAEAQGAIVFHSFPRAGEPSSIVFWDTDHYPDYRLFLNAANAAGAKLVTLYAREFDEDTIEDALDQLADATMDRDDQRAVELRLKEMRGYNGFTCQIELSFDLGSRTYLFDVRTEWFEDLNDLLERIEDSSHIQEDEPPIAGGYYSKN